MDKIYYCDDCGFCHAYHYGDDGKLYDSDGDEAPITAEYDDKYDRRGYYKHVADTGDDYLNLVWVKEERPVEWRMTVGQWIGQSEFGLRVLSITQAKHKKIDMRLFANKKMADIPEEVKFFFGIEKTDKCAYATMPEYKSLKELKTKAQFTEKITLRNYKLTITAKIDTRYPDGEIVRRRKSAGRQAYKETK